MEATSKRQREVSNLSVAITWSLMSSERVCKGQWTQVNIKLERVEQVLMSVHSDCGLHQ